MGRWCLAILMLSISQNAILRKVRNISPLFHLSVLTLSQMVSSVISSYPIVHTDLLFSAFLDFYSNPYLQDRREVKKGFRINALFPTLSFRFSRFSPKYLNFTNYLMVFIHFFIHLLKCHSWKCLALSKEASANTPSAPDESTLFVQIQQI